MSYDVISYHTGSDLAAQCQVWAVQYPQIAGHLTAAARQFVPVGVV